MKKFTFTIFAILCCLQGFAQEKLTLNPPKVDERVELLSIVFRLAGKPEYSSKQFKLYADRIEQHFGNYKNHALIQFTQSVMNNQVGYDAVMSMAIHLDKNFNLIKDVAEHSLDERWNKENTSKFVSLLQQFYKDAECEQFFSDNAGLYAEASKRFRPVYEQMDLKWYQTFYGKEPSETFLVVNGLGNGGNNYGPALTHKNGKRDVYAIMGAWSVDSTGMPTFKTQNYFPTLLHEFNHSFVNYLTEKNKEALRSSGEQIFAVLKDEMSRQAYGNWQTVLNEALVRASVIKYMKDHRYDSSEIFRETLEQVSRGFIWIKGLVEELEKYYSQRNLYPTLESYMPQLVEAYKRFAQEVQALDDKRPHVASINEFANGDTSVDAATKTITVNFDKPLQGKGYSIFLGNKGKEAFPKVDKVSYANENRSVVMEVQLEAGKEYQFVLKGNNFKSTDGIAMKDYEVNFKTGK